MSRPVSFCRLTTRKNVTIIDPKMGGHFYKFKNIVENNFQIGKNNVSISNKPGLLASALLCPVQLLV
jgi:hypothetical protein